MKVTLKNVIGDHVWVDLDGWPIGIIFIEGSLKGQFHPDLRCNSRMDGDALRQIADKCDEIARS